MHDFVFFVALLPIEPQLISLQYHEVLLVALSLCFEIAMTGMLNDVLFRIDVFEATEALQDNLIGGCPRTHDSRTSHALLLKCKLTAATSTYWLG